MHFNSIFLAGLLCSRVSALEVPLDVISSEQALALPIQASMWRLDRLFHHTFGTLSCPEVEVMPSLFIARTRELALNKAQAVASDDSNELWQTSRNSREGRVTFSLSPIGESWIALAPPRPSVLGSFKDNMGAKSKSQFVPKLGCSVEVSSQFWQTAFFLSMSGVLVFLFAEVLAQERYFRLSAGSL